MGFTLHPDLQRDGILLGHMPLCLVLLINDKSYPWFVLVPQRENIREVFELSGDDNQALWSETRVMGAAVMSAFRGNKLNLAALGNVTPQLHVHLIVRYSSDPAWPGPIWGKHPLQPYDQEGLRRVREKLAEAKINGFRPT